MQLANTHAEVVNYFNTLSAAINHHGDRWRGVVGQLCVSMFANSDPDTPFEYRTYNGNPTKQTKFTMRGGTRVKVNYLPHEQKITIFDFDQGQVVAEFKPDTELAEVDKAVRMIAKRRRRPVSTAA